MNKLPTFDSLMNPIIRALRALGGSASIDELDEKVVALEGIPEEMAARPHDPEKSNQTAVAYRLAWARTYLKKLGYLENSSRGVWALTPKARNIEQINVAEELRELRTRDKELTPKSRAQREPSSSLTGDQIPDEDQEWREKLHHILTKEIDPQTFERLTQRLLRESGFVSVEVTGRTGDGGIDGKGIARIHGFMSFNVIFQCKRYQGSVPAGAIRDFRGAMVGRADKGLFITTGAFTPAAIKEATRDGAPHIDLVDGDELAEKLKELGLGIKCEMIEKVIVDEQWFRSV